MTNSMAAYITACKDYPLLSKRQEQELAIRIQDGDLKAREILINSNLRLVMRLAQRQRPCGLDLCDLIAEGNMGLIRAVNGFDASFDTRFSTYASWWIKQAIRRAIMNFGYTIRLPSYVHELVGRWCRAEARLVAMGHPTTDFDIAHEAKIAKRQIKRIKTAIELLRAGKIEHDDGDNTITNRLQANDTEAEFNCDDLALLHRQINNLPALEREVLKMRYGMGCEEMTLEEVGKIIGRTRERVRQIQNNAQARLKERMSRR
jgi:RNA polymerase primary sigma factor